MRIEQDSPIELMQQLQRKVLQGHSLDRVMDEFCLEIEKTLRGFQCAIFVVPEESNKLELLSSPSMPKRAQETLSEIEIRSDGGPIARAAYYGQIAIFPDLIPIPYEQELLECDLVGAHCVPVMDDDGKCDAVFAVFSRSEFCLDPKQVEFVQALSVTVRLALQFSRSQTHLARERKAAEAKSKLATLGELTSGIAHEINNPLFAIQGVSELLKMMCDDAMSESEPPDYKEMQSLCEQIESNVGRIDRIVRSLKAYSRNSTFDPYTQVSVGSIVDDVRELSYRKSSKSVLKENLEFILRQEVSDLRIACRPGEIVQVLLNLVNNAIDAVQDSESPWIRIEAFNRIDAIKIVVTDSGRGIPDDVQSRLFETFFTTKPRDKGTGMGLSISKRLISAHGGELYYNPRSPFTQFVVELPLLALPTQIENLVEDSAS